MLGQRTSLIKANIMIFYMSMRHQMWKNWGLQRSRSHVQFQFSYLQFECPGCNSFFRKGFQNILNKFLKCQTGVSRERTTYLSKMWRSHLELAYQYEIIHVLAAIQLCIELFSNASIRIRNITLFYINGSPYKLAEDFGICAQSWRCVAREKLAPSQKTRTHWSLHDM